MEDKPVPANRRELMGHVGIAFLSAAIFLVVAVLIWWNFLFRAPP